jgi:hypothetical protein
MDAGAAGRQFPSAILIKPMKGNSIRHGEQMDFATISWTTSLSFVRRVRFFMGITKFDPEFETALPAKKDYGADSSAG